MSTYRIGTATVNNGSTAVTGSGTLWVSAGIRPGDFLFVNGLFGEIASVQSNTALTLVRGWPGISASGQQYSIALIDDGQRSIAALNQVLQQLGSGTLSSLAALTASANQMPFFTGAGVMGLTALTSQARTVLASALLSVSGNNLVTTANARLTGDAVTQSAADATAGRLVRVGDYGNGGVAPLFVGSISVTDNTIVPGFYRYEVANGSSGGPASVVIGILNHRRRATGGGEVQLLISDTPAGQVWFRSRINTAWSAWVALHVASGSGPNGTWSRLSDGLLICRQTINGYSPVNVANGALWSVEGPPWPFPAEYATAPDVYASVRSSSAIHANGRPLSATQGVARLFATSSIPAGVIVNFYAIGQGV